MKGHLLRIGLFGGTFNPIHIGHLQIARQARMIANLDILYFIPTAFAPHKNNSSILSFNERCRLIEERIAHEQYMALSTIESELPMPSYTFRTLSYFRCAFPYSEQFFISGSCDFLTLHTWEQGIKLLREYNYIIVPRNGIIFQDVIDYIKQYCSIIDIQDAGQYTIIYTMYAQYIYLCIPIIPISSTELRSMKSVL